jgi:hypothetical protein
MADLFYSDEALNVKSVFYQVKTMVFVEGDDDVLFWHHVFSKIPNASVQVESAGSSSQIDQYITKILSGKLNAIAARDSDFLPHTTGLRNDPRILYTFGYSIENSLYTAESITALAKLWCKNPNIPAPDSTVWLTNVVATLKPLIHLDLANRMSKVGACTVTDNCTQLMKSEKSCLPCGSKVTTQVNHATALVPADELALAVKKLGSCPEELIRWLRGHFLASAVLKYLHTKAKGLDRKFSLSLDALYVTAMGHFGHVLRVSHPHQDYYIQTASAAYKAIRRA